MSTKIRAAFKPEVVLETWRSVIEALPEMNEAELKAALDAESEKEDKRADVIERLHRRYTKLRSERERQELLQ